MRVSDIIGKEDVCFLKTQIYKYTNILLTPYLDKITELSSDLQGKEIFDNVWGPVGLNAGEVFIVDSPILQRLRKIKQLGLASYVYCGADYSRFAHTIGVFKLSGDMAKFIGQQMEDRDDNDYFIQVVRLAALFHDVGHMYYSHVSERYFVENENSSQYEKIKGVIEAFADELDDTIPLHEIISVIIVNSPEVKKLLELAAPKLDGKICRAGRNPSKEIDKVTEYMSCLIMGQVNDAKLLPYYQVINGPVDADKCDYLLRDSKATNVPAAVDIYRLIHKINIVETDIPVKLPESTLWVDRPDRKILYPTIKVSAVEALNQLLMARSIMYNSVYYHQKVRTAETMFRSVLEQLDKLEVPEVNNFTNIMQVTDEMFGDYFFDIMNAKNNLGKDQLKNVCDYLNNINHRNLLKRACSINISDMAELDIKYEHDFKMAVLMMSDRNEVSHVEALVKIEYTNICEKLGRKDGIFSTCKIMEFPKVRLSDSLPNLMISYGNGELKEYSSIFQTVTWIESKESRNKELYLVTDCKYRGLAFLALQKILFTNYHVYLKQTASMCSKVSKDDMWEDRKELLESGYYDDALILISDMVLSKYTTDIKEVATRFRAYEGPKGHIINEASVISFLEQFFLVNPNYNDCEKIIHGVLELLLNAVFINRTLFDEEVTKMFENIVDQKECIYICPLGGVKDSAFHLSYYLNDLSDDIKNKMVVDTSLSETLKNSNDGDTIILFDDGAYSGKQVSSIIQEYMGVPSEKRETKEEHVKKLSDSDIDALKNRNVIIAYICFNTNNKENIMDAAKNYGIIISDIKHIRDMQDKCFDRTDIFKNDTERELVKKQLENIGLQILESVKMSGGAYKENWSKERVEKSSLGYNDSQQMVILKSSVPTYTIIAFWMEGGVVNGWKWEPLFLRTDK